MKTLIPILLAALVIPALASAAPVLNPANGHYYEFVPGVLDWVDANTAAEAMTHAAQPGYLATITSADENAFVYSMFATGVAENGAWIGGEDSDRNSSFYWIGGPEAGTQFSLGAVPTAPANYANWGGAEPNLNAWGPTYAVMNLGLTFANVAPGEWWDAPFPGSLDPVIGYIVEFGESPVSNQNTSWGAVKRLFE